MKNVKLGHALSFYMHRKVFSLFFTKKILGFSKAKGFLCPPYLVIANFECSVHIYRGPWIVSIFDVNNHLNLSKTDFNWKLDNQCRHTGHASRHLQKRFFLGPTDLVVSIMRNMVISRRAWQHIRRVGPVPTNLVF
jgi:hypothetical protein